MANLGSKFYPKLVQVASEVGMAPEDLIAVMISESGMKPSAGNPNGGAVGLIQFMPNTLKGLNFKGTQKEFGALDGEQQLDYIKKYVSNQMKLNGGPFTSAAQYYVAKFFPVALQLPGIKRGDPKTVFVEENPATVEVNGKKYSKKYYDAGIKLNPHSEISAYKANPLFHGSVPGAITYGDMMKQIEKNKKTKTYLQAMNSIKDQTNYVPGNSSSTVKYIAENKNNSTSKVLDLANLLLKNVAASKNKYVLNISAIDDASSIEFARILQAALKEEMNLNSEIGKNCLVIEAESKNFKSLIVGVKSSFELATKSIGDLNINLKLASDSNQIDMLNARSINHYHNKFLLKFAK